MAIRMRLSKKELSCIECRKPANKVLEMYELQIGEHINVICDECNSKLFNLTLKAQAKLNGKVKSKKDMEIINRRKKAENDKFQ